LHTLTSPDDGAGAGQQCRLRSESPSIDLSEKDCTPQKRPIGYHGFVIFVGLENAGLSRSIRLLAGAQPFPLYVPHCVSVKPLPSGARPALLVPDNAAARTPPKTAAPIAIADHLPHR
jgi:hypothetical protein